MSIEMDNGKGAMTFRQLPKEWKSNGVVTPDCHQLCPGVKKRRGSVLDRLDGFVNQKRVARNIPSIGNLDCTKRRGVCGWVIRAKQAR
jgi:hypothetical protein